MIGIMTSHPSRVQRVRTWLGLERNILVMLGSILIIGMGEELWVRFIPKYLEYLGATAWIIALYGTLKDLLDAVYQYPGGWIADRIGRKRALILFTILAASGYLMYWIAPSWPWILAGTLLVMAWSSLTLPALFAVIGDNLPEARRATGFGVQSILKRIPIIVAPIIGGWLVASKGLSAGIHIGLIIAILLAFFSLYLIHKFYREVHLPVNDGLRIGAIWQTMDPYLKRLLVADCFARWAEGIPKVFIVLYVLDILHVNAFQFGWLTAIQMIASIVFYIPISKMSDQLNRKPFVLITFLFFAFFPLMLVQATDFIWVVIAFIFGGLREIGEPARKAMIVDLANRSARARAVGVYYLIRGLVVFPASLVGGWLWKMQTQLPFYVAFAIGIAGSILFLFTPALKRNK
jgi:MFS family permease